MKKIYLSLGVFLISFQFVAAQNLAWARNLGGTGTDICYGIDSDVNGNIYMTGFFSGTADFDPGPGVVSFTSAGYQDIFVCKLNSTGNLVWAKSIGGAMAESGNSVAVDGLGNVIVTGYFNNTVDFDPGTGITNLVANSSSYGDIFIVKLDPSGNFIWAAGMGGMAPDRGITVEVDNAGDVYTTGNFGAEVDFDPGAGVNNILAYGEAVFIHKLSAAGNFLWTKQISDNAIVRTSDMVMDSDNNIFLTGEFIGQIDFDPSAATYMLTTASTSSDYDTYVCKLTNTGNFAWAKQMGGDSLDKGYSIALDGSGNVYSTGYAQGTSDFDPGAGVSNLSFINSQNTGSFISKLDSAGNFVWVRGLEAASTEIAVDGSFHVHTSGDCINNVDFDPGPGVNAIPQDGMYHSELDSAGNYISVFVIGNLNSTTCNAMGFDGFGNLLMAGEFSNTYDFDPGTATYFVTSAGYDDAFLMKIGNLTGVYEPESNAGFGIYPNPAQDGITITFNETINTGKLEVYTVPGQKIIDRIVDDCSNMYLNLEELTSGLYFIKLTTGEKQMIKPLVVY